MTGFPVHPIMESSLWQGLENKHMFENSLIDGIRYDILLKRNKFGLADLSLQAMKGYGY